MNFDAIKNVLTKDEIAVYTLRSIYAASGYTHYRMSKFEEYDLYVRNKDFLISDNVITFTDTDGRLLALKPDVTLSIIKNSKDSASGVMKAYYDENVYRAARGTRSFKEIRQAGLECLGDIGGDMIVEVLGLAKKSLDSISEKNILEISDLDIVLGILNSYGISKDGCTKIISSLGTKSLGGVYEVCDDEGLDKEAKAVIGRLVTLYGTPSVVLNELRALDLDENTRGCVEHLSSVIDGLGNLGIVNNIIIDFSVVNDMKYYNGLCFRGFVDGIPTGILSGGQYDRLMKKMKRSDRAIGFAVYLDELERLP